MAVSDTSNFELTLIPTHCCNFEWVIKDSDKKHDVLHSPEFCIASECTVKYKAILELKNVNERLKMKLRLELSNKCSQTMEVKFRYQLKLGRNMIAEEALEYFLPYTSVITGKEIDWFQALLRLNAPENLSKCDLDLHKIIISGHILVNNCCQKNTEKDNTILECLHQLQSDFKSLWKNQQFTDVQLNVQNEVVLAHKFVLCSRSPVFRTMFDVNLKESIDNSVNIQDMEKSELEHFLEFLYTGVLVDCSFKTMTALYSAADKYEVATLQAICREALLSYVSEDTVTVILKLAHMHSDEFLKEKATVYICNNFDKVEETPEWDQLIVSDARLTTYILKRISTTFRK